MRLFGRQQEMVLSKSVYLVEHGANISAEDDYALREAASNGHFEIGIFSRIGGGRICKRE